MRVIVYTKNGIAEAQLTAVALQELGYDAIAYSDMAEPEYRAPYCCVQGFHATPLQVKQNVLAELVAGTVVVIHPLCDPADVAELAPVCRYAEAPMVALESLPDAAPTSDEAADALRNAWNAAANGTGVSAVAPTPEPAQQKRTPMVHFTNHVLDIDGNGNVIEPSRGLREQLRGAYARCQRWLARVDRSLTGLKNPMVREAMDRRRQATPVKYHDPGTPVATTG